MKRRALALLALLAALPLLAAAVKYGAPLGDAPKVALADLVKSPDAYAGKTVKTEGTVSAVCQGSGCWMVLKSGDKSVRITFKDYGFFVPKDSAGRTAVMEGVFGVKTLSEDKAKHYASETAGANPDAIKGDQKEMTFVATGVELTAPSR